MTFINYTSSSCELSSSPKMSPKCMIPNSVHFQYIFSVIYFSLLVVCSWGGGVHSRVTCLIRILVWQWCNSASKWCKSVSKINWFNLRCLAIFITNRFWQKTVWLLQWMLWYISAYQMQLHLLPMWKMLIAPLGCWRRPPCAMCLGLRTWVRS